MHMYGRSVISATCCRIPWALVHQTVPSYYLRAGQPRSHAPPSIRSDQQHGSRSSNHCWLTLPYLTVSSALSTSCAIVQLPVVRVCLSFLAVCSTSFVPHSIASLLRPSTPSRFELRRVSGMRRGWHHLPRISGEASTPCRGGLNHRDGLDGIYSFSHGVLCMHCPK